MLEAAPFLIIGLLVTGILRHLLGPEATRKLFGANTRWSLLQAWLIGMLLPVCSLGVIPVIREMRRSGISGGTILAFALTAPLFNPLSLLYGLTLSDPFTILAFALCSLVIVTFAGIAWDRLFPGSAASAAISRPITPGLGRMFAILVAGIRETVSPSLGYVLLGLLGVGLLGAALPAGALQRSMNHGMWSAPLVMSFVAIPIYATPMLAMSQLGSMFQHGNSIGAAFVLLAFGAGMNLGLLAWMIGCYGWKKSAVWIGLLLAVVLVLAYGIDQPLFPEGATIEDHTHAFDVYCRPFEAGSVPHPGEYVINKLRQDIEPFEWWAATVLGAMLGLGLLGRLTGWGESLENWLSAPPAGTERPRSRYDIYIPGPVLGVIALIGLLASTVIGCYVYYPPVDEAFEEIKSARTSALSAAMVGDKQQFKRWVEILDDWTRKLEVGVYLREWQLSEYCRVKGERVREKLEMLEHMVENDERDEAKVMVTECHRSIVRLRRAYQPNSL